MGAGVGGGGDATDDLDGAAEPASDGGGCSVGTAGGDAGSGTLAVVGLSIVPMGTRRRRRVR